MELAATMTEAALSSIQESLAQLSVTLGRMAARQEHMLVVSKKMTAALSPITTTTPMLMPGQLNTEPSSSPLFSAVQVVGVGDAILAPSMPTRCSTLGLDVNGGSNQPAIACPPRGNTEGVVVVPLETSLFKPLHPYGPLKFNMLPPTTCSMQCCHEDTSTQELALKQAMAPSLLASVHFSPTPPVTIIPVAIENISSPVDSRMADEVFTDVGGLSLFRELGLDFAEEVLAGRPLKDTVWDVEVADSQLTHIGSSSLFLELDTRTNQLLLVHVDSNHGAGGTMIVKREKVQCVNINQYIRRFGNTWLGMDGNFDVLLKYTSLWPTEEMDSLSHTWDRGGSRFTFLVLNSRTFAGHTIFYSMNNLLMVHQVVESIIMVRPMGEFPGDATSLRHMFQSSFSLTYGFHSLGYQIGDDCCFILASAHENQFFDDALRQAVGPLIISQRFGIEMKRLPNMQYQNSVDYNCSIQFVYHLRLGARELVHAMLRCTKRHTAQVRRVPTYPCSLDQVLVLYQSVSICLAPFSLVGRALVNGKSEQIVLCVIRKYQNVQRHDVPLQGETKNYMQMRQGFHVSVFLVLKSIYKCKHLCLLECLAKTIQCRPCNPGACYSLQVVASNIQYMLALIGNIDLVLDYTRLRSTNVERDSFSTQAGHLSNFLCQELNLKFGLAEVLDDAIGTLIVVSLYYTCLSSGHFTWSTCSPVAGSEWYTMLMRNNSQDYGYAFYSNQQSKLYCTRPEFLMWSSKYLLIPWDRPEFLMWSSKYLLMPWDPGDVQNKASRASLVQSIRAVALKIPWDPGVITIHMAFGLSVSRLDNLSAIGPMSCCVMGTLLGDGIVTAVPWEIWAGTSWATHLVFMGRQYLWTPTKGAAERRE